jgi:hypothetical protein
LAQLVADAGYRAWPDLMRVDAFVLVSCDLPERLSIDRRPGRASKSDIFEFGT